MDRPAAAIVLALVVATVLPACSGGDGDDRSAFCKAATDTEAFADTFADFDPDDVPAAIETLSEARDIEIDLRREAPDAVRADLDLLVQFLDDLVDGLEAADPESDQRPPIYDEVSTRMDQVEAAGERVENYVDANCRSEPE